MITVKMLLPLLKGAEEIMIEWSGLCKRFDPDDALDVDAYGQYVIDKIYTRGKECYELRVALTPVKATED